MASKGKSKADLEAEIKYLRKGKRAELNIATINGFFKYGGLALIAYFGYRSIDTLAGKMTLADINLNALYSFKNSETDSYNWWKIFGIPGIAVGVLGVIYGYGERKLRQFYINYRPDRYEKLEKKIDSGRTSSMLTQEGDTRPEDK